MLLRPIPSTRELLPVIGIGTWQRFDVNESLYDTLTEVLKIMHVCGGRLIDSSPMYGKAEKVIGDITSAMPEKDDFFYATKVWTQGKEEGMQQVESSFRLMKRNVLDLVQIHNLVDWKIHLPYLRRLKEEGRLRYIGITHYQDSAHEALIQVMKEEAIDFVQFNYSILSRHAENRLLPFCADRGVATIINRPFGEGALFRKAGGKPLPAWANELDIKNWSEYFIRYILSHPAVNCIIPATGNPDHARENFMAGSTVLDKKHLKRMADYLESL